MPVGPLEIEMEWLGWVRTGGEVVINENIDVFVVD